MTNSRLYVGNIPYSTTDDQLQELFTRYGEVKETKVIPGKGFGFVEMIETNAAETAMAELNNTDFNGRTLRIDEARPPQQKRPY